MVNPIISEQKEEYTALGQKVPPIFCAENRFFWVEVRRFMIWLCRKIGEYYGLDNTKI
jgi:hypothetical protein